ncbi:MAG TPA: hypothetical protein GX510_10480 [Firmicutes bacterium]|nr:hypothetical protein [Candidatus Fermentithermobacillaceae bacterium]
MNGASLDRCLRQLIAQGRTHGGYITYQIIADTLRSEKCSVSLDALDSIYERLTGEGISIVDELPAATQGEWQSRLENHYERVRVARRTRRRRGYEYLKGADRRARVLCPEDVLDQVMFEAQEGVLSRDHLLGLIQACGFSALEVVQLVEYLWSRGFDIPEIDLSESECSHTVTEDYDVGRDALGDWDMSCPMLEDWYRKLVERRG